MAMPKVEGMWYFGTGISKLKGQWTGRESQEVAKQLLPIVAGQRSTNLDLDLAGLVCAILEFSYHAHASRMTDEDIGRLEKALEEIHRFKNVIIQMGLFQDDSWFDDIPKPHMLSHYAECICEMGMPDNYSMEVPEHLHVECAKRGWRASNKVQPTPQMVKFIQRMSTNGGREQRKKSCVVYGKEVKGPMLDEHRAQSITVVGAAEEDTVGSGDSDGDGEAKELEQQEDDDEAAEGLQIRLEKGGRPRTNASEHMVYLDPTLSIAVNLSAGQVKGFDIIDKYGATDFIRALHLYPKKNMTHRSLPDFFLPTMHHYFLLWNRIYLHHHPLPFDPKHAKQDVIHAQPQMHHLGDVFDVALLLQRKEVFGLNHAYLFPYGYRVGRVRVIFSLPKELEWLCSHPLVYVELFNPFSPTTSSYHALNTTSHALTPEGKQRVAVVLAHDIVAACHLAPQFQRLDPSVQLRLRPDLLEKSQYFYHNHFHNHYIFGLVEDWQSTQAAMGKNL
ncbi:hypothetical protein FRC06_002349 [Ceratobasidium sp. 370]|nr:hypothetical protein FRC06_002349 [Ceratobasidium sp. 370]